MPRIVLKQVQKRMAAEGQDLAAVVYIFFIVDESVKWEPLAVRQNEQIALAVVENRTIRQILRIDEGDGLSVRFKETFQVLYIRRGLLVRRQQGWNRSECISFPWKMRKQKGSLPHWNAGSNNADTSMQAKSLRYGRFYRILS